MGSNVRTIRMMCIDGSPDLWNRGRDTPLGRVRPSAWRDRPSRKDGRDGPPHWLRLILAARKSSKFPIAGRSFSAARAGAALVRADIPHGCRQAPPTWGAGGSCRRRAREDCAMRAPAGAQTSSAQSSSSRSSSSSWPRSSSRSRSSP
jgi:hypothetical protein